jgi:manganese/zinc-transporting P-type ATPase C
MHALSVLLALTPGAAATALNSGQKSYITLLNRHKTYLRNPNIIEKLARADHIVFDKTGTLTDEIMKIETVLTYDERYSENDLLAICAACESGSMHPISVTLQKKAEGRFDSSKVKSSSLLPSKGVVASYEDYVVAIGNKDLMLERNVDIDKEMPLYSDFEQKLFTPVFVSIDNKLCGMIVMKDIIKKDAYEMIKRIKEKGIRNISILTGDNQNKALALASELGISSVYSNCSFEEKERIIEKLKSQETVIMVGDGINDAEAMRAADVSISFVNSSADIIKLHSDCIIFENDMTLLADIIPLSVKAYESIHQSITFSQIYNLVWGGIALFGNVDAFAAKAINTINSLAVLLMDKRIEYLRVNRDKGTG